MYEAERTRDSKGRFVDGHGLSATPEFNVWKGMKQRVFNPNSPAYQKYGGRGIDMDPRWAESFTAFYEDMGTRSSDTHSLDRIDNDKGYWKSNCRWATKEEQMRNRSNNVRLTYLGETKTVAEWAHEYGQHPSNLCSRMKNGWSVEDALLTPKTWHRIKDTARRELQRLWASGEWTKVALAKHFGVSRDSVYRILAEVQ
jgi:hypothetical protein